MQEAFLHYLWKFKKFELHNLKTTSGDVIIVSSVGHHNDDSGPDFFNGQLEIDGQLWAGNIEIHIKSSDWYKHRHEVDKNYDNVILHVVWEHDVEVFRKDQSIIPTLELKNYINSKLLNNYRKLFNKQQQWINCEKDIGAVDNFILENWLERLYLERLERKSLEINALLRASNNNWEAVFFKMLFKNFGLKVNGDAFFSVASSFEFSMIRKLHSNLLHIEALLYGQSGLLDVPHEDVYFRALIKEYDFLKQKFQLSTNGIVPVQFFRLRPQNFPTIRMSQLANLYHKSQNIFSKAIEIQTTSEAYKLFEIGVSNYWETHFTFSKVSKASNKKLSKAFIDLVLINTIVPIKFAYAKHLGKDANDGILKLIREIKPETNSIINKFKELKISADSAFKTQALLQLKNDYCFKNKCLSCAIGNTLLNNYES